MDGEYQQASYKNKLTQAVGIKRRTACGWQNVTNALHPHTPQQHRSTVPYVNVYAGFQCCDFNNCATCGEAPRYMLQRLDRPLPPLPIALTERGGSCAP